MTNEQVNRIKKSLLKCAIEVDSILELKQQIEKMKCCENCKHRQKFREAEIFVLDKDELKEPCNVCHNHDKWEMYE